MISNKKPIAEEKKPSGIQVLVVLAVMFDDLPAIILHI